MKTLTAKEIAGKLVKDFREAISGYEIDLPEYEWGTHIDEIEEKLKEYAKHYCDSKITKDNREERKAKFTKKVLEINRDNNILTTLEVLNTNGTSFIEYWTEKGINDRKMRFEKQASFDIKLRLLKWKSNNYNKNNAKPTYTDKVGEYLRR